jgi:hypothetical protein
MVRNDYRGGPARARKLEAELAPVIKIMNRTGMTAAGIMATGPDEIKLNRRSGMHDAAGAQRLASARDRIMREADASIRVYALPDAMLYMNGKRENVALTLFGDERPGHTWETGVRLVPAENE